MSGLGLSSGVRVAWVSSVVNTKLIIIEEISFVGGISDGMTIM